MENLVLFRSGEFKTILSETGNGIIAENSFAIDSDLKVAYFISDNKLYSLNLHNKETTMLQDNILGIEKDIRIICSTFLLEEKLYFALLPCGKMFTFDTYNLEPFEGSIKVPDLITAAKFSHDQELLALATLKNQMFLFNKIMVLQASYDMNQSDYGSNQLVNVNWGSKSTQFHGEGMRDKRVLKEEYYPLEVWDDEASTLDWRGDDNYFVVNFVTIKGFRMLKLFNRQGVLQHTSEYVAGLEKHIAWKPSGGVIASSMMLPNKQWIVFFEKNGLKHRYFELPFDPHTFSISHLAWSQDSEILLICGFEGSLDGEGKYTKTRQNILLYTTKNYHWYLKQRLQFDLADQIGGILWDELEYLQLHLLSQRDTVYRALHYNRTVSATKDGRVLVIDGNQLLVSDFEHSLVPPPMCTYEVTFASQIIQVCTSSTGGLLAVYLNDDQLVLLQQQSTASLEECIANLNDFSIVSYNFTNVYSDFASVYRPLFTKKVSRIGRMVMPCLLGEEGQICGFLDEQIALYDYKQSEEISFLSKKITDPISAIGTLSDWKLLLGNATGPLLAFEIETRLPDPGNIVQYRPRDGEDVLVYDDRPLALWTYFGEMGEPHIICLTLRNSLYFDNYLLFSCNVNSALLFDGKYLLLTTTTSLFYCWPLDRLDVINMYRMFPPRNVERGAQIIAASISQVKVVLQMPRGNLEAFHPRLLVLSKVEHYIQELDFLRAFELLRKNRINLNYICDFDFTLFTENSSRFLQQVGEMHSDWICLFLSDLSEENALCSLNPGRAEVVKKIRNKVDTVCDLLRVKITQIPVDRKEVYLNALLLTYIKKTKPEIDDALAVVKALPSSKMRDSAIKYMLYVVNVNRLFDEALGTYDFDILLMVASKSNKDPKEYIPLVNEFKAIKEEEYRRYRIDMHLRRYQSALTHLSRCGEGRFEEALELIEQRHLFREAIEIYGLNKSSHSGSATTATEAAVAKYSSIWNLYGDYLFKKKYYQEAAIAFRRAGNDGQAFKMYLMDSNWSMASVCARQLARLEPEGGGEQAAFERHIQPVAQQLVLNGNYIDGAYIQEHYLHQPREAFLTLVKGREWAQALRCLHDHDHMDREQLFEGHLLPELKEAYESTVEAIRRTGRHLTEFLDRLKEVKETQEAFGARGDSHHLEAESDVYSDTSSMLDTASLKSSDSDRSTSSLKTNKSRSSASLAKQQKRREQRKYVWKHGSPNEDLQLVFAIKELLVNGGKMISGAGDSRTLVVALYELFMVEQSAELQRQLQQLYSQFTATIEFIWKSEYFERRLAEDGMLREAPKLEMDPAKWSLVLN